MKYLLRAVIYITIPFFLLILFASLLTTKPYLMVSKGMYASHDDIYYDQDYAIERIIGYLNYRYDDLYFGLNEEDDSVIMRDTEISHMVDVKNLYTTLRLVALGGFVLGVAATIYLYKTDKKELYKTYRNLYIGPLFFTVFVGGYIVVDFGRAFTVFHQLFFTNDDWILYADDVLILLLPSNFWMVSGLLIISLFVATNALIYWLNAKYFKKYLTI